MKTEITAKEAIGKTITDIIYSSPAGQMIICFDDSFSAFGVERGYEGEVDIINKKVDLFDFGDAELIKARILTKTELEEGRAEKRVAWQRTRDTQDYLEYKRLKSKFEKGES